MPKNLPTPLRLSNVQKFNSFILPNGLLSAKKVQSKLFKLTGFYGKTKRVFIRHEMGVRITKLVVAHYRMPTWEIIHLPWILIFCLPSSATGDDNLYSTTPPPSPSSPPPLPSSHAPQLNLQSDVDSSTTPRLRAYRPVRQRSVLTSMQMSRSNG